MKRWSKSKIEENEVCKRESEQNKGCVSAGIGCDGAITFHFDEIVALSFYLG